MGDFEKIINIIVDCVGKIEANEITKLKITYTLLKIYQSEEHLDNVCVILDKTKVLKS